MNMEELIALLAEHGIAPHALGWGTGEARTIEKLLEEVNKGECELISLGHNFGRKRLIRRTHILLMEVYFDLLNGMRLALAETAHVRNLDTFASPRSFIDRQLDVTITEKGMKGETTFMAALRALIEELRVQFRRAEDFDHILAISFGEMFEHAVGTRSLSAGEAGNLIHMLAYPPQHPPWRPQQAKYIRAYASASYPGLETESKAHWYMYLMRDRAQFALGYHDRDGNKLTTYDWRNVALSSRR
ncbi:MAG: hypothetical protein JWO84_380 [Parcubacteria group bacterium]|nr:hypothetical protein [Parcubacteria group bacterium]